MEFEFHELVEAMIDCRSELSGLRQLHLTPIFHKPTPMLSRLLTSLPQLQVRVFLDEGDPCWQETVHNPALKGFGDQLPIQFS